MPGSVLDGSSSAARVRITATCRAFLSYGLSYGVSRESLGGTGGGGAVPAPRSSLGLAVGALDGQATVLAVSARRATATSTQAPLGSLRLDLRQSVFSVVMGEILS
jgi:hypothetical protein